MNQNQINRLTVTTDSGRTSSPQDFEVVLDWPAGPRLVWQNGKGNPEVGFDLYYDHVQVLIFEESEGDQTMAVRLNPEGKVVEIEIPERLKHLIVYEEDQSKESQWLKSRQAKEQEAKNDQR